MNRQEIIDFIDTEFGVSGEHLWLSFPDFEVFRNTSSKKWFGILMDVERKKAGLEGEGKVDLLDVKCDPILIGSLINKSGYLPGYHMNKNSWLSIVLDGGAPENEIKDLIRLSYELTGKK